MRGAESNRVAEAASLDTSDRERITVVEVKVEYLEGAIKEHQDCLRQIDNKVDSIGNHIAKQNGILPRLEKNMDLILDRVGIQEKQVTITKTRTKILWGALVAFLGAAVGVAAKVLVGL